jgi:pimeloyl-ACP methyl ester carboxylesterase
MTALSVLHRPAWLPTERWPFPTAALNTRAGRLAVTDVGDGPTLLFIHVGSWSFVWRDVLLDLASRYRVITVDPPGSGLSSRPSAPVTLHAAADAVGDVIDALDLEQATVIMHDVGGPVALAAAGDRPARINGLVAVNALGWPPSVAALRGMLTVMGSAPVRESAGWTGWSARLSASSFGCGRHWDRTDRRIFLAGMDRSARRNTHRYLDGLRREHTVVEKAEYALRHELSGLPLLTVFGSRNDPFGFTEQWKELFPRAEQHAIKGGNHYPMGDDPQLCAAIIHDWHCAHFERTGQIAPAAHRPDNRIP